MEEDKILYLNTNEVYPDPNQPRTIKPTLEEIEGMAQSIISVGQTSPIIVHPKDEKGYKIQDGECRWNACKSLNVKVKAIVKKIESEKELMELQFISNEQRFEHNFLDREKFITKMWESGKYNTYTDLAKVIGKSNAIISNNLKSYKIRREIEKNNINTLSLSTSLLLEFDKYPIETQKNVIDMYKRGIIKENGIRTSLFELNKSKFINNKKNDPKEMWENIIVNINRSFNMNLLLYYNDEKITDSYFFLLQTALFTLYQQLNNIIKEPNFLEEYKKKAYEILKNFQENINKNLKNN